LPKEKDVEVNKIVKEKKSKTGGFFSGVGRRKTAVARAWLHKGKGEFLVNDKPIDEYFSSIHPSKRNDYIKPFHTVGISHPKSHFSATVKVRGSSIPSQLEATILAFSKALQSISEDYEQSLKKANMLRRDPRMKEKKKYYLRKARKRPQFSKR